MKTKLLLLFVFSFSLMTGQEAEKKEAKAEKKEKETAAKEAEKAKELEKKTKEIAVYKQKLTAIKSLLASEQTLLINNEGKDDVTKQILNNIKAYVSKRDSITNYIYNLENDKDAKIGMIKATKNKVNPKEARYTYLNGINFDFNNNNKTNYVGHFNIYVPANDHNKWGINTGLLKVNYLTRDSIVNTQTDNVLKNPLDVVANNGDTYNQQYNRYATQTKVSSFSLYVQPMYLLGRQGAANFYLHGHLELLASKFETSTKIKTLQSKEITLASGVPIPAESDLIKFLPPQSAKTVNLNSGYFGLGGTFDFNFLDNCILFIQGTAGWVLNYADNYPTLDKEGNYSISTSEKSQKFYLVRTYFQYNTSKATQVLLGTDIRGNFPKQSPYSSVYIGLNVGLDSIFN